MSFVFFVASLAYSVVSGGLACEVKPMALRGTSQAWMFTGVK